MLLLLRGRPPIVVNVDSAREDDDEDKGDGPQEDHHGSNSCYYIEWGPFVHDKYSAIERNDAKLDESVATHGEKLNGEFELPNS